MVVVALGSPRILVRKPFTFTERSTFTQAYGDEGKSIDGEATMAHLNACIARELSSLVSPTEFVAYESNWVATNRRRGELVDKEISGTITAPEVVELAGLQAYADYYLEKVSPRPTRVLEELENRVFAVVTNRKKNF
jgi:hypothetical protein